MNSTHKRTQEEGPGRAGVDKIQVLFLPTVTGHSMCVVAMHGFHAERTQEKRPGRAAVDEEYAVEDLERGDRVAEHDIDAAVAAQCVCDALE
eukprot:scaffold91349_cov19-Tisochrysis_lutea.AAC.1